MMCYRSMLVCDNLARPLLSFHSCFFHSLADVLAREDSDGLRIGTDASLSAYSQTKIHRNRNRMCANAFHDAGYAFSFAHDSLQKTRSVCNGTSATLPLQTMPCRQARIPSKSTCGIYTVCVCASVCVHASTSSNFPAQVCTWYLD